jgi:hypothetical protein
VPLDSTFKNYLNYSRADLRKFIMAVLTLEVNLRNFLQSFMLAFALSELETKNSRE